MKKSSLLFLIFVLALPISNIYASNLVHYSMNEASGNTVHDMAVGDFVADDATTHNTIWSEGICGAGIYVKGDSTSYLSALDSNETDMEGKSEISVSIWIKPDGSHNGSKIIYNKEGQYELAITNGNKLSWALTTNTTSWSWYNSNLSLNLNQWNHVVFTYDGNKVRLYLNGSTNKQEWSYGGLIANRGNYYSSELRLGKRDFGNDYPMKGWLDEFKLFDRQLSEVEVDDLFHNTPCKALADYRFDECKLDGTNTEVKDSSGNDYNGIAKNGLKTKSSALLGGGICNVGEFDGNSYTELSNTNNLNLNNNFSFISWIKTTSSKGAILSKVDPQSNWNGYVLSVGTYNTTDKLSFWVGNGNTRNWYVSNTSVNDGNWHQVGVTVQNNVIKFYVDGVNVDTKTFNGGDILDSTEPFRIGRDTVDSAVPRFNGNIDEVKVFNSVLDGNQIANMYNNEKNSKNYDGSERVCLVCPVVNYRLDDLCNSGGAGFLVAESTRDLNGTIKPDTNATLVSKKAKVCTGAEFNGVNQYIEIDDNEVLDGTQRLTTMAWIYPYEVKQTNGTNARGIFSKRNHYSSNAQNAYGVFFWNGHGQVTGKAKIYVDIDGNTNRASSTNYVEENKWTHIAVVFDGRLPVNERTKIYVDGVLDSTHDETSSVIPDYNSNFYIGNLYTGTSTLKVFKGIMDEVKIMDEALSANQIQEIYSRENGGRDYQNRVRNCICPVNEDRNVTFNAVDSIGGCYNWANNIQTKVIGSSIDLMVLAQDENGTPVGDANVTKVELLTFNDSLCTNLDSTTTLWTGVMQTNNPNTGCFNIPTFVYNKATKCAKVRIYGNLDANDVNSTSIDNFAIRPDRFKIDINKSSPLIAGETYAYIFKAIDSNNNASIDYNESVSGSFDVNITENKLQCKIGDFNPYLNNFWNFENGYKEINSTYSEVGDINITIQEINGSEFAKVDIDDTNWSARSIEPFSLNLKILPHHFEVDSSLKNNYSDFTYLSQDLNMSALLDINITAKNEQNITTENYNSECYAKDINFTISYEDINISLTKILWQDTNTSDINRTDLNNSIVFDRNSSIFTTDTNGTANIKLKINFDRNRSNAVNPFDLNITNINVTDQNNTDGIDSPDSNATFYYGRVKTKDITTNKKNVNNSLHVEVYSSSNNNFVKDFKQESLSWYIMELDHNRTVGDLNDSSKFNSIVDTNITIDSFSYQNGKLSFNIKNQDEVKRAYIHVDIPKYLWYSKYSDYNSSGDCSEHPCFTYEYNLRDTKKYIKSGDFNGTTIGDHNATIIKKGVKVFR